MLRYFTATSIIVFGFLTMNTAQAQEQRPLSQTQERDLQPRSAFKECEGCPEMIVVPPGDFLMGARKGEETFADTPQHPVRISAAFAVSKTEVTVEQYAAFVRDTGHELAAPCRSTVDLLNGFADRDRKLSWRDPGFSQQRSSPVTCVSWHDAKAYVNWLAKRSGKPYRLLSEAEWEFAARAGAEARYPFGDRVSDICLHANGGDQTFQRATSIQSDIACNDGHAYLAPGGIFPANGFGLHDMQGNVSEWVEDCSVMWKTGRGYGGAPADGSPWMIGDCSSHVARGGDWCSGSKELQSSARGEGAVSFRANSTGIRVARTLNR
jgi:formylglycine-generating enzyme required for sulfatase activity